MSFFGGLLGDKAVWHTLKNCDTGMKNRRVGSVIIFIWGLCWRGLSVAGLARCFTDRTEGDWAQQSIWEAPGRFERIFHAAVYTLMCWAFNALFWLLGRCDW
jgi:hypothetical protein